MTTAKDTFDKLFEEFSVWVVTQEDESQYAVMLKTTADFKQALYKDIIEIVDKIGDEPMPRIDKLGNYVKSPKSFVGGFEEARVNLKEKLATYFGQEEA